MNRPWPPNRYSSLTLWELAREQEAAELIGKREALEALRENPLSLRIVDDYQPAPLSLDRLAAEVKKLKPASSPTFWEKSYSPLVVADPGQLEALGFKPEGQ